MKILVTGSTGLVGRSLIPALLDRGDQVVGLSHRIRKSPFPDLLSVPLWRWSHKDLVPLEGIDGLDAIIHLSGESIANKKWTPQRKALLWESRCLGTARLRESLALMDSSRRPKVLVSASAVGFYGDRGEEGLTEFSKRGEGFLAELCEQWERESFQIGEDLGLRVVVLRLGWVLSSHGGILSKMVPLSFGGGKQWVSWIHRDDLISFILMALNRGEIRGPYNLCSPNPLRNLDFSRIYSSLRWRGFPVFSLPSWLLKGVLGERSSVILGGQRVYPLRAQDVGFRFQYDEIFPALESTLGKRGGDGGGEG